MNEHEMPCPHCDGWADDHVFDCPDLVSVADPRRETQPPCGVCKQPMESLREFVAHKCPGWREGNSSMGSPAPGAVAEARASLERCAGLTIVGQRLLDDLLAAVRFEERARHQELIRVVREYQDAVRDHKGDDPETWKRTDLADEAVRSFPLPKEG